MKVSKATASNNHHAILQAAAAQLRGVGFDQMGVAEVARAAGLTHGALYSHFQSKDALTTEATRRAFEDCIRKFSGLPLSEFLQQYLSTGHRDSPEEGCPTAALVSEVPRQPAMAQAAFRDGVNGFLALAAESLRAAGVEHGHDRAVLMFAAMVGGLALSRAVRDVDEPASADILRAVGDQLRLLLFGPGNSPHSPDLQDMRHTPYVCLAENLRSANRAIARYYGEYLRDAGLGPTQFTVLMHLHDLGEASMTQLAREMETDRTTMVRNISVLKHAGHVAIVGGTDRRMRKIRLTERGVATLKRAFPLWQEAQQDLHHFLGQDAWTTVATQMRVLASIEPPASKRTRK